ncbi:hypothetical protein CPSG_06869 [Coccidioides posadasii str. Silveira]|uniref:Uncharacterized protein n=2 Tax=Coccidioides posadasii TaxID=199306 RepID=E9DAL7_COCPS|nr:hypothetical protein CPSG_06869 [Coccidioides posadasii str. Silveira]KMM66890.1 hypothetical protein CPAG_03226 [Coccidioides posadasii RMSCC 3488]
MADKGEHFPGSQQPGDTKNTAERLSESTKSGSEGAKQKAQGVMDQAKETASKATESMSKSMGMGGEQK